MLAGLTVGVVALPLALGFGITTGLGAGAGLMTAIVAGLVAAIFGGSHVQVSGPTGAMTVVLVPIVQRFGADAVLVVGLIAGVMIMAAGVAGLGRYLAYVPWPVVEGFTVGIAIVIFLQQVPAAVGVKSPEGENAALVAAKAARQAFLHGRASALLVVAVVAVVMVLTTRLHRALPASLLAVTVGTLLAELADLDIARIGTIPRSLPAPALPSVRVDDLSTLFGAALAVAMLGALESLLSARVADGMVDGARHDPDRELVGQGLANLASPLFGGMPATGAIARTAVNARAGGRTRVAAITHSVVLVGVVYLGGGLVSRVPLAALAGVLMTTAVRMVELGSLRSVFRSTRADGAVLALTAASTVLLDLIAAVELGVAVAAVLALRAIARSAEVVAEPVPLLEVSPSEESALLGEHILTYRLDGALFFGAAQRFLAELASVSDVRVVILRLSQLQVLDATGAQALGGIVTDLERRGITVLIKGAKPAHQRVLEAVGALDGLAGRHHLFSRLDDAVDHARQHISAIAVPPTDPPGPEGRDGPGEPRRGGSGMSPRRP